MKTIQNMTMDEERALYGLRDTRVLSCRFDGPADGESALKESRHIQVEDCDFLLRYPFWHVDDVQIAHSRMTDTCRAALWYCRHVSISDSVLGGIKALRECEDITIQGGNAVSPEFGWKCKDINISDFELASEYAFLMTEGMKIDRLRMKGKYSFQYVKNATIRDSVLDTKDAFWHTENVTVMDSVIKGEYLGWYSQNLRLIRCQIIGTQPLCYCKGLELQDCTMTDTDLSFENSEVEATIRGSIDSVKNPIRGHISADRIGELILDQHLPKDANCVIHADIERKSVA